MLQLDFSFNAIFPSTLSFGAISQIILGKQGKQETKSFLKPKIKSSFYSPNYTC